MTHPTHEHGQFHLKIADASFEFRDFHINDPVPTGRQILQLFGCHPVEEFLAIAILPGGVTETLRLDETFDLRAAGVERVVTFRSDRTYRFEVDRQEREWGQARIKAWIIKTLADVDPAAYDLYQDVRGNDPLFANDADINLSPTGVERFYTMMTQTTEGLSVLSPDDDDYLSARGIRCEVASHNGQSAVILREYKVPDGKFDHTAVDVLILLPAGYPDALVDMFYCAPWLRLVGTGAYARCADVPLNFNGRDWQRWSRHNDNWRPGIDGIHTVLARLDRALQEAQ